MTIDRRRFNLSLAGVAATAALPGIGRAQAGWRPQRTVDFIVPAGPSGALDQVGRAVKQVFDEKGTVGQPIVVTNRPGGGGKIAFDQLLRRAGDPHILTTNTHGYLSSHILGSLDVLPHRDLTPIAVLLEEAVTVAVRPDSPYKTARDLVDALKKDPTVARIAVATAIGNHIHVGVAKPLAAAGVDVSKLTVVAFKSSADSVTALLGGHIEVVASTTPNVVGLVSGGRIRLLAHSSTQRLGGVLSNVPTWREAGVDSDFRSALGILAAKGITPEQIAYWEGALRQLVETEEWKKLLDRNQSRPFFLGHAETVKFYEEEYASMRALLPTMGIGK